jgi:WD40 repeat protein/serine/threonine protein kinase
MPDDETNLRPPEPDDQTVTRTPDDGTAAYQPRDETAAYRPGPAPTPRPSGGASAVGQVIANRYILAGVIGEGGMGSVYLATQTQPVKRQVAVKLIRAGLDSKGVLARFDAERQALAVMDHPNIARIYDGGVSDLGQPYFVMELVRGQTLTAFCDQKRLPVRARLELFVQVCQAVQHAHQKGIIHRDLKPGNVLVTEVDGRPTPKVIDFGVAKATEQKLTDVSYSDAGAIVGTPAYMSPEQADPSAADVDTRTDVYALGVILYELLTGTPPIDASQFKRGALLEILRMVREVEPPRPSTKLSGAEALPSVAANRDIEPAALARLLQGELDWVVMKAIEKDPERRYDTALGLAQDVQRYLADEVVEARPPSRLYRLSKFVRRNRLPVIAAGLVALALLGGVVGTTLGLFEARKQEGIARREAGEKEKARQAEAERADELGRAKEQITYRLGVSDFLLASAAFEAGDVVRTTDHLDRVPPAQRGWEWGYLKRQAAGGLFTLYGHTGAVRAVACSPDGSRIVSAGLDGTARVWDAGTGTPVVAFTGHTTQLRAVAFSPDGKRVVTGGADKTARVWDPVNGQQVLELKGHSHTVGSVAFSPDGTRIATGCQDQKVRVFDAKTGERVKELADLTAAVSTVNVNIPLVAFTPDGKGLLTACPHELRVWDVRTFARLLTVGDLALDARCVGYSPDGGRIVTGASGGLAHVWDARTGKLLRELKGHADFVAAVAFSPDGRRVATGSFDRSARLWDADSGVPLREFKGHSQGVNAVCFTPDAARVVTGGGDQTLRVWDARPSTALLDLTADGQAVEAVSFSPDGKHLLTGTWGGPRVWDAATGETVLELKGSLAPFKCVAYSADGRRIAGSPVVNTPQPTDTALVWDATSGKVLFQLKGHTGGISDVQFSPDGTRLVTCAVDGLVKVWDGTTGEFRLDLKGHSQWVRTVAFSPDGGRVASGGEDGTARIWDATTGEAVRVLKGNAGTVRCVRFSKDGKRLLCGGMDGTARVWDAETGEPLMTFDKHPRGVTGVAFSPDETRVLTGSEDNTARVWDVRTGTPLLELKGHTQFVQAVAFSPDGTRVVTASLDATVRAWDASPLAPVVELTGHTGVVTAASFSADGTRVVTAGTDNTARVWDAASGNALRTLTGHTRGLLAAAFSPDGERVVTGGWDQTARVWDARTGEPIHTLTSDRGGFSRAHFSADGTKVVTADTTGRTKVWDANTGKELPGEAIPAGGWRGELNPKGTVFAAREGERVRLVPLALPADERDRRLRLTAPNRRHFAQGFEAARGVNDAFAARFYLDRLIEYAEGNQPAEVKKWQAERAKWPNPPK